MLQLCDLKGGQACACAQDAAVLGEYPAAAAVPGPAAETRQRHSGPETCNEGVHCMCFTKYQLIHAGSGVAVSSSLLHLCEQT